MKGALEACRGGGAKKGTVSGRRAAKQAWIRSVELQTNPKKHSKKQQRKTIPKNTSEAAENKSKYRENQKQIQGNKYKQTKAKTGTRFGWKQKVAMEA
jgi:hypothetical protein